jgi:hypothetical protein
VFIGKVGEMEKIQKAKKNLDKLYMIRYFYSLCIGKRTKILVVLRRLLRRAGVPLE